MTGYGKAESQMENTKIVVELRGLNSKSLDLSTRLAPQLRNKELEIRTIINQRLERGKVDLSIQLESVRACAGATQASEGIFQQAGTPAHPDIQEVPKLKNKKKLPDIFCQAVSLSNSSLEKNL